MGKVIVALSAVVLILGLSSDAAAQLIAGSPEDKLYQQIIGENTPDKKMPLCLEFEKQFPQSKVLSDIYLMLMDMHRQKNETAKVLEYGEKVIKVDPDNITALMDVARNLSMQKRNLDRAVQYAQRAVELAVKLKGQPAPAQYTEDQWKQYVDSTDSAARSILAYARSVRP